MNEAATSSLDDKDIDINRNTRILRNDGTQKWNLLDSYSW